MSATSIPLNATRWSGSFRTTGRRYNASLAVFSLQNFQVAISQDGCTKHAPTSTTAKTSGCFYATNAGFFSFPPHAACEGNLITASQTRQFLAPQRTNIAVNRTHAMIGYSTSATIGALSPVSLVSGLGWLVRDGAAYVNSCREFPAPPSSFVTEWAPRTGAGIRADGTGLLLTVDGIEGKSSAAGSDLYEFADLLIELGALHAMNLDGGGSTTAVYNGTVFNRPHCADSWTICERDVTSITCVVA
jgi:N-acetylglucosamine-1-phosphodiester alpha-N-acetylglucosaminidase